MVAASDVARLGEQGDHIDFEPMLYEVSEPLRPLCSHDKEDAPAESMASRGNADSDDATMSLSGQVVVGMQGNKASLASHIRSECRDTARVLGCHYTDPTTV